MSVTWDNDELAIAQLDNSWESFYEFGTLAVQNRIAIRKFFHHREQNLQIMKSEGSIQLKNGVNIPIVGLGIQIFQFFQFFHLKRLKQTKCHISL